MMTRKESQLCQSGGRCDLMTLMLIWNLNFQLIFVLISSDMISLYPR